MNDFSGEVPTFFGNLFGEEIANGTMPEYGNPLFPVLIHIGEHVRVILGTTENDKDLWPDLMIERKPKGWGIFIHPRGGEDPAGCIYVLDDGRTFLQHGEIRVLGWNDPIPEIFGPDKLS